LEQKYDMYPWRCFGPMDWAWFLWSTGRVYKKRYLVFRYLLWT